MVQSSRPSIQIDLNEFKLHLHLRSRTQVTLHFDSPSRRFYLSVIALVVNEMKRLGKIKSISLQDHVALLVLLNESIGGSAGSSDRENLLHRIYSRWKDALPNLEEAPLFKVLGKKKEVGDGAIGKIYSFTDAEKDEWANLFEYKGSHENVRLKFAIDKIGIGLDETSIIFGDSLNAGAWDQFISSLKRDGKEESQPVEEALVPEPPAVALSSPPERKTSWLFGYRWVMLVVVIVVIAAVIIWELYTRSAPHPEVIPNEKIVVSQPEKAPTAVTPSVEVVSKEKVTPPSPEKVSKTVTPRPPKEEIASKEKMAYPLPDVPSIAVLPFVNLSEDAKQEFLCDGITENIITALSKLHNLFVISRQSTSFYKGKAVKVKQVSEELGVRYVLEGGVQRSGDRIRINAQLIDALTGHHLWSERYDRDQKDIFALQDEITFRIVTAMQLKLIDGEQFLTKAESVKKPRLECYLKITEGFKIYEGFNIEATTVSRRIAEEAIAICPEEPYAYVLMGFVDLMEFLLHMGNPPQESIEKGIEMAQKALAMDDSISMAHSLLCSLYIHKGECGKAIAEGERAVVLNPGGMTPLHSYGRCLTFAGRPEEAIPVFQKAIRISPFVFYSYSFLGIALRMTGRFDEAVLAYKKAIQLEPDNSGVHASLAATYSMMGRKKEARAEAAEVLRINPKFSVDSAAKNLPFKDQSETDKLVNALRKAGLK
jgi:TolB-like protein